MIFILNDYEREKLEQMDLLAQQNQLREEYFEVVKEQGAEYLRYKKLLVRRKRKKGT
jgi:hypothetical protein